MTCLNPMVTKGGYTIGCRKCKNCRLATVYDKVGRAYAEAAGHPEGRALCVALTIGRDDAYDVPADNLLAHILQPSILRLWFQSLRRAQKRAVAMTRPRLFAAWRRVLRLKRGRKLETASKRLLDLAFQFEEWIASPEFKEMTTVRYIVSGEHGKKKGRGHFHAVVFFRCKIIPKGIILEMAKLNDGIWSHGFSYWKEMNENDVFYLCKYCLKDLVGEQESSLGRRQLYFTMSRFPPLGADYFRAEARRAAMDGLPFSDLYAFGELRKKKKQAQPDGTIKWTDLGARRFKLSRASLKLAAGEYMSAWEAIHGNKSWPVSEVLERYEDELAKSLPEAEAVRAHKDAMFVQRVADKNTLRKDRFKRAALREMRSQWSITDLVIDDALNAALAGISDSDWEAQYGGKEHATRRQVLDLADDVTVDSGAPGLTRQSA